MAGYGPPPDRGGLTMGWLDTIKGKTADALSWGRSAAEKGWTATTEFGSAVLTKASKTWDAAKAKANDTYEKAVQPARNAIAKATADAAENATTKITSDPKSLAKLLRKLDKRDRYGGAAEPCPGDTPTTHPDKNDGRFLGDQTCPVEKGAACDQTTATAPSKGVSPTGCTGKGDGKPFPRVIFTNGINNSIQQACDAMRALANSRCVEVVGVYNATYANKNLKKPTRLLSDYKDAASDAVRGARLGATLLKTPLSVAVGAAIGATPEVALQEAGRIGMTQDVLDCLDTIMGSGNEAASRTLTDEILTGLNGDPPRMTLYAHSQGGLNTAEAIAQARGKLVAAEKQKLMRVGMEKEAAGAKAAALADKRLAGLEVNLFGTLEQGLPDGPVYKLHTNKLDPVPRIIRAAQQQLRPDVVGQFPANLVREKPFEAAPAIDPMAAHGMIEAYIPYLDRQHPTPPCCPGHQKPAAERNLASKKHAGE